MSGFVLSVQSGFGDRIKTRGDLMTCQKAFFFLTELFMTLQVCSVLLSPDTGSGCKVSTKSQSVSGLSLSICGV